MLFPNLYFTIIFSNCNSSRDSVQKISPFIFLYKSLITKYHARLLYPHHISKTKKQPNQMRKFHQTLVLKTSIANNAQDLTPLSPFTYLSFLGDQLPIKLKSIKCHPTFKTCTHLPNVIFSVKYPLRVMTPIQHRTIIKKCKTQLISKPADTRLAVAPNENR